MIIECDSCRTKFRLDDSRITPGGVRVRCTKCQSVFIVKPPPSPDDVSVEEMFGVSTESGRAPEPSSAGEAEAGVPGGAGGDEEEAGWGEGADEEDLGAGLGAEGAEGFGESGEETGDDEESTSQAASGFEGLDFSFAMDKSDEEDEDGEAEPGPGGDNTLDEGFGAGEEPGADDATDTGPAPAHDEDEGPSSGWGDELPGTEGDDEGEGASFDLGMDASAGDDLVGSGDNDEEEDLQEGWNINIDLEDDGQDDEGAESGEGLSTEGFAGDTEGPAEDATPGFEGDEEEDYLGAGGAGDAGKEFGEDEGTEDEGLMGNTLADAIEGLEDEEQAGVEEQLRELEKKVIPFNISTQGEQSAPAPEQEDEQEGEEAGDLDWPTSTPEPEVPDAAAWLDEDRGGAGQDVASAAAGYATAATGSGTAGAAPKPPSRAKAGLLLVLLAIIIIGGAGLYFSGAFDSTGGGATTAEAIVDIELMKGYVVENKTFGNYFAVEAMVRNRTESPQQIEGARGVLFNSSGARIAERLTTPGRVLSAEDLRTMTAAELEKYFKEPTGGTIPAKGVIPVMVLFTDMPVGISEYGVDVIR